MNIAIAFVLFIVVACLLWGLGELHYKNFNYVEDVPHHPDPTASGWRICGEEYPRHHEGKQHKRIQRSRLISRLREAALCL